MRHSIAIMSALLLGCEAMPPRVVVAPPRTRHVLQVHPLDVRFERVDIERMPMLAAVDALAAEVHKTYGENFAFSWSYTAGAYPAKPEGRVSFHGKDVSTRNVLDEFCRQTGWSYHWNPKHFIDFRSGPVPGYEPEIRRPRPNQSLQPTALWRCASMSILISVFPVGATLRSQSGG
jgi:hypothetical protein